MRESHLSRWGTLIGVVVGIVGTAATLWFGLRPPALYSLRIQTVDPSGNPVRGATVHVSTGNEPHLLPDGWWEVQIPHAKVPSDQRVTVWGEHPDWAAAREVLHLGRDPEPSFELHLRTPTGTILGTVVDDRRRAVGGARVTVLDQTVAAAETDHDGRFTFHLLAAVGTKVTIHVEHPHHPPQDAFCYVGAACPVYLRDR